MNKTMKTEIIGSLFVIGCVMVAILIIFGGLKMKERETAYKTEINKEMTNINGKIIVLETNPKTIIQTVSDSQINNIINAILAKIPVPTQTQNEYNANAYCIVTNDYNSTNVIFQCKTFP